MGIGVSVFLIAAGAILTWAITFDSRGIDLDVVGVILMLVGGLGLFFSLAFWSSFSPFREREVLRDREVDVVHERGYRPHRHVEVQEDPPAHRHVS